MLLPGDGIANGIANDISDGGSDACSDEGSNGGIDVTNDDLSDEAEILGFSGALYSCKDWGLNAKQDWAHVGCICVLAWFPLYFDSLTSK